jgi:polyisoprenoid-binding protein YceI
VDSEPSGPTDSAATSTTTVTGVQLRTSSTFVAGVGVAVIATVAAGGLFYLFGRSTPAAVSLGGASATPTSSTGATVTGDLGGTWTVDPSIGSFSDFTGSFVGYRVQEELVNIGAATAVGRTPDVTGTLVLDGTTISSVEIEADLTTLQSDNDMRDDQLGRQGIETDTYPTAAFVLSEPIELESLPADGQTISAAATGELTLHGVTNTVEVPLEAALTNGVVTVVGSLPISFADYGIPTPESMRVLSIADQGVMEFQLQFTKT